MTDLTCVHTPVAPFCNESGLGLWPHSSVAHGDMRTAAPAQGISRRRVEVFAEGHALPLASVSPMHPSCDTPKPEPFRSQHSQGLGFRVSYVMKLLTELQGGFCRHTGLKTPIHSCKTDEKIIILMKPSQNTILPYRALQTPDKLLHDLQKP